MTSSYDIIEVFIQLSFERYKGKFVLRFKSVRIYVVYEV